MNCDCFSVNFTFPINLVNASDSSFEDVTKNGLSAFSKAVLKEGTSGSYPVPVIGRFQPNSREFIDKIISSSGISL